MPSADCVLQLRGLLVQLDHADRTTRKEEVTRLCKELLELGRRWPDQPLEDEQKAFDRLGRQLTKFADAQQRDIVATFRPLREDVQRRLSKASADLNSWLGEAPDEKASPERLAAILQAIEAAPQLRWYKQCTSAESKGKFLMALGSVVRSVQAGAPLHAHVAARPTVLALVERIASSFFVVPEHGNILKLWHDGRLKRYNVTLWRAAKSAADQFKDDLQVRLVTALRRKASQVAAQGNSRPNLQMELCKWPMVKCPLATAFLDFVAQRGHELGNLGKPQLSECPPHSLRPKTLCRLLERLDAFELVPGKDGAAGIVRLRWEAVTALAFKSLGTKPKASSAPPVPNSKSSAAPPVSSSKAGAPAPLDATASAASSPSLAPESAASKAAPRQPPPLRHRLVERPIPWGDANFLQRLVRRGIQSQDEEWNQLWHQYCKQCRITPDVFQGTVPKGPLTEFVERNLAMLRKKEWAKGLLYKGEGQTDEIPEDSDDESSSGAGSSYAPGTADKTAAGGLKRKAEQAPANRARAAPSRPPAANLLESSSGSESSQSAERRKRQERKKKRSKGAGMLGYGDYFGRGHSDLQVSPEMMMMNQMMGMSMMMQNPLAMMGMGGAMMPQMGMMPGAAGMKIKKDDKSKKGKIDTKGVPRERERPGREKKLEDPRLKVPAPPPPPMRPQSAKDAMIDAADL